MKKQHLSQLMMASSMAIFGTLALFVRNIPLSSGEIALCRAVLATILIGTFLFFTRQKLSFGKIKKDLPLLLLSGVAMGINWILLFEGAIGSESGEPMSPSKVIGGLLILGFTLWNDIPAKNKDAQKSDTKGN